MKNKSIYVFMAVLALGATGLFVPVRYTRVIEQGTDSFETHRPLFGKRQVTQDVTLIRPTKGVGIIAVDLRRSGTLAPIEIRVLHEGQELAVSRIDPSEIVDDAYAWAQFDATLVPQAVTISLAAQKATEQSALGIRFEKESKHTAVAVREVVPAWQRVALWRIDNPDQAEFLGRTLVVATLALLMMASAHMLGSRKHVWVGLLVGLGVGTFLLHLPAAQTVEGVFGGDAFNFLLKANSWLHGQDPFASDFRKAPLLPLLLLPAYLGIDAVWWGRIIGLMSAALAAVTSAVIVRRLRMPASVALGAGMLVTVNRELWWESLHGLSNVPYAALVTLGLLVLASSATHTYFMAAAVSGLTFLMRYEGALLGAVLLPAIWIQQRLSWHKVGRMFLVAAILVLIPFVMYPFSGQAGVRTPADIAADGGLNLAQSFEDFRSNWDLFELFIGRQWLLVPMVGWQFFALGLGILAGIYFGLKPIQTKWLTYILGTGIVVLLVWQLFEAGITGDGEMRKSLSQLLTLLVGVGIGYLGLRKPAWLVPVLIIMLLQILVVTAILPKTRYYVQVIPFIAMMLAVGVYQLSTYRRVAIASVLLAGVIGISYADALRHLPGQISGYNAHAQSTTVMIQAGRFLQHQPGTIASGEGNLAIRPYVPDERVSVYVSSLPTDSTTVLAWLEEKSPDWVIAASDEPSFAGAIKVEPALFRHEIEFTTEFGDSRVDIYRYGND